MSKYDGHTPGPWACEPLKWSDDFTHVGCVVAVTSAGAGGSPQVNKAFRIGRQQDDQVEINQEANARLIADAPLLLRQRDALLEEVKAALTTLKLDPVIRPCALSAMVNLRAAIAACEKID